MKKIRNCSANAISIAWIFKPLAGIKLTKATAEGYDTTASGDSSHAEGQNTTAMLVHVILRITEYGDTILKAVKDAMSMMPAIFPKVAPDATF